MSEPQGLLRKAAILVASLDTATADRLLDQMGSAKAAKVRNAVMELTYVDPREEERVIAEFLGRAPALKRKVDRGVELDESLAAKFASRGTYIPTREPAASEWTENSVLEGPSRNSFNTDQATIDRESQRAAKRSKFEFLYDAPPEQLAKVLQRENPQLIAVVMYHLPPERSAALLKQFIRPMQTEVLRRLADVEETDPEVLKDIEAELESLVRQRIPKVRKRGVGAVAVDAILAATDPTDREQLENDLNSMPEYEHDFSAAGNSSSNFELRGLKPERSTVVAGSVAAVAKPQPSSATLISPSERNAEMRPAPRAFVVPEVSLPEEDEIADQGPSEPEEFELDIEFTDLARLDNRSLAILLRHTNPRILMLALAGADQILLDRLAKQLPASEGKALQQKIRQLGPIRLSDVDEAQYQFMQLAARLEQQGLIRLPTSRTAAAA